jgi:hypothetical protein
MVRIRKRTCAKSSEILCKKTKRYTWTVVSALPINNELMRKKQVTQHLLICELALAN